jgi:hypothetical protein
MRSRVITLALIAGLIVTLSVGAEAAQKKAARHSARGTITSIDANQLVITEKVQGKDKQDTFAMNSATQKTGNPTVGSPVTVQYKTENNQNVATSVRARPVKAAKTTSPKAQKKSLKGTKKG